MGKKVLLPVGRSQMNSQDHRVFASLTKEQANNLPELEVEAPVDYDREERVREAYRSHVPMTDTTSTQAITGSVPSQVNNVAYERDTYSYQDEPVLYGMNDRDHTTLKLYEERLTASKRRQKTGEVAIGKHVETETARVAVPVEKERVVVERVTPKDAGKPVASDTVDFREGEVAHMEIYEEVPDIHKEAVVRKLPTLNLRYSVGF